MASGSVASPSAKARGNNRSLSGTFGSSTIGTIIFISLCIMGGYMLTTNSVRFPPSSTWTPINIANKMATQLSSTPLIPKRKSMEGKDSQFDDDSQSNSAEMDGSGDSGDNNPSQDTGNGNDAETNQNDEQESAKDDSVDSNQGDAQAENVQSDEDQRERSDEQRQEEEQSEGATSDAQTQHDEASVNEQQTDSQENQDGQNDQETSNEEQPPKEAKETKESWSTQATESTNQKELEKTNANNEDNTTWELCNVQAGRDYIPCLDNEEAIAKLKGRNHYEHRERHCPEVPPTCLVPLPEGYKTPIEWPKSRDKVWYKNVPTTKLAEYKGHQNWVKVTGEYMTFPGGGTQFVNGANHYLDFIQQAMRTIAWGKHTRVVLDVGCGVASFGGFLFDRDVLTMSLAPKDEHEAQVQFALERGIPAISAVMGTQRLPFPSKVFDLVHCARCRVPWHIEGGALLLELNRVLRPGGFFVWSATPVYRTDEESVQIWKDMSTLTMAMCWELVSTKKDTINKVGAAIYRKPVSNKCYANRQNKEPPICNSGDDPNAAWYVPLQACMHEIPTRRSERGSKWPEDWPARLETVPYWLDSSQTGVYGKPAPEDFTADYEFWKQIINKSYLNGLGISWSNVRNVMDMRAVYGGFAAVLKDMKLWVMNVVNIDAPDTLPIIYERGLFGIYHDWCESFSTYPRSYDLLHAHHLFSNLKKRCKILPVIVEIDRIVRPGGKLVVRDEMSVIEEVEKTLRSLHWEIRMSFFMNKQGMLSAQKTDWRPESS